jgi:hypothetical protein
MVSSPVGRWVTSQLASLSKGKGKPVSLGKHFVEEGVVKWFADADDLRHQIHQANHGVAESQTSLVGAFFGESVYKKVSRDLFACKTL